MRDLINWSETDEKSRHGLSRAFKHPTKHTKPVTGDVKKEKQ